MTETKEKVFSPLISLVIIIVEVRRILNISSYLLKSCNDNKEIKDHIKLWLRNNISILKSKHVCLI